MKKLVPAVVVVVVASLAAAGCGGGGTSSTTSTEAAQPNTTTKQQQEASPLAAVQKGLEKAGFTAKDDHFNNTEAALLVDTNYHVLLYASEADAKQAADKGKKIIGDRGEVQLVGPIYVWYGEEQTPTADQQATFNKIVAVVKKTG